MLFFLSYTMCGTLVEIAVVKHVPRVGSTRGHTVPPYRPKSFLSRAISASRAASSDALSMARLRSSISSA